MHVPCFSSVVPLTDGSHHPLDLDGMARSAEEEGGALPFYTPGTEERERSVLERAASIQAAWELEGDRPVQCREAEQGSAVPIV